MNFPREFLDEIRARISVSDIVSRRVALRRRGEEFVGLSPFKKERTPSFTVNDRKGFYHCFASGEHGDIFTFLMKTEGLDFPEAVAQMAARAGLEVPRDSAEERARAARRATLLDALAAAAAFFHSRLRLAEGRAALAHCRNRGMDDETINRFALGYAPPGGDGLLRALKDCGASMQTALEAGLFRRSRDGGAEYPFFRDRLMFPIRDRRGRVIAFGGRFLGDAKAAATGKYVNSPESPIFVKGQTLYNHDAALRAARPASAQLIVAEGYTDVIALTQAGFDAAVAPLGTALTEMHLTELWRMSPAPLICFDGDEAGRLAADRAAARALPLLGAERSLKFVFLPEGLDPADLLLGGGRRALAPFVEGATPLDRFLWERESARAPLDSPEQVAGLEKRLFSLTEAIRDQGLRRHYRRAFADRLWLLRKPPRASAARGRNAVAPVASPTPPAGKTLRAGPGLLGRRLQQAVLAALINHPDLLAVYAESLNRLTFAPDIDKIRRELQKAESSGADLDTVALCEHLQRNGLGKELRAILDKQVYMVVPQASPQAASVETAHILDNLLLLHARHETAQLLGQWKSVASPGDEGDAEARLIAMRRSYDEFDEGLSGDDAGGQEGKAR